MASYSDPESQVIGCALMDVGRLYDVYNTLHPYMFKSEVLGNIYRVLLSLYDNREDVNFETICSECETEIIDRETIGQYLQNALNHAVTSSQIKSYAKIVINDYKARRIDEMFKNTNLSISRSIDQTIGELIQQLEALRSNDENRVKKFAQVVDENKGNYYRVKPEQKAKVTFGIRGLDDALNGVGRGNVCVVGARPSIGKSALVNQLILNTTKHGLRTAFFDLEMPEEEVYERFVAYESRIKMGRIRGADSFESYEEKEKFDLANETISECDGYLVSGTCSVNDIHRICKHLDVDLIVIDYLQLLKTDKRVAGGRTQEVGELSRGVKRIAMSLKVPIVLLSQLNRASEQTETKEPSMAELREAGDIENDASQIVLLWRDSKDDINSRGIKIAKNRQGELYKSSIMFNGATMRFCEKDEFCDGVEDTPFS